MENFMYCRVCFVEEDKEKLSSMFAAEGDDAKNYKKVTGILLFSQFNIPAMVCARCSIDLALAAKLKQVAMSSHTQTTQRLGRALTLQGSSDTWKDGQKIGECTINKVRTPMLTKNFAFENTNGSKESAASNKVEPNRSSSVLNPMIRQNTQLARISRTFEAFAMDKSESMVTSTPAQARQTIVPKLAVTKMTNSSAKSIIAAAMNRQEVSPNLINGCNVKPQDAVKTNHVKRRVESMPVIIKKDPNDAEMKTKRAANQRDVGAKKTRTEPQRVFAVDKDGEQYEVL